MRNMAICSLPPVLSCVLFLPDSAADPDLYPDAFRVTGADAGTFVSFDNYATILFGSGEGMGRRAKAMQELFLTSFKNTDHSVVW